jgi:hypothetical protein
MPNKTKFALARANLIKVAQRKGWRISNLKSNQNGGNNNGK